MKKEEEKKDSAKKKQQIHKLKKQKKIIINLLIILYIMLFIILAIYVYQEYKESRIQELKLGARIEQVYLDKDTQSIFIKLAGGSNVGEISKIKFIFIDRLDNERAYETTEGTKDISLPFGRNFWQWLFGKPAFIGIYDYQISAKEIGLESPEEIREIRVVFEYKTEEGEEVETEVLDTEEPIQEKPVVSGGGGGGTPASCVPSRDCSYYYNLNQCGGSLDDGCSNSLNCYECWDGYSCSNNSCTEILECYNSSDCDLRDGWYNVSRLIEEQCFTINQSSLENRNFTCNLTDNICEFTVISQTAWINISKTNAGNGTSCDDGLFCTIDDSCNGGICSGQSRACPDDSIACSVPYCNETADLCGFDVSSCSCTLNSDCNDGNPCTDDICNSSFSCENINDNSNNCNDGLYCTINDRCSGGSCTGDARVCSDSIFCTMDSCNESADACDYTPNNYFCNDYNQCTSNTCVLGTGCQYGNLPARTYCSAGMCDGNGNCVECLDDGDCDTDGCYSGIYRDYSCSSDNCQYTDMTTDESDVNGNCDDGRDNDCDGQADSSDSGCMEANFPEDYVSYWKFDTSSGGTTPDESGRNDAKLFGDSYIYNDPERGNVLSITPTSGYAAVSDEDFGLVDEFSVSLWANLVDDGSNSLYYRNIIEVGSYGRPFFIELYGLQNPVIFTRIRGISSTRYIYSGYRLSDGKWVHIALTYGNGYQRVYVNGEEDSSLTQSGELLINGAGMQVGKEIRTTGSTYEGLIDDLMIYDRALSASEIQQIYDAQSPSGAPALNPFARLVEFFRKISRL